MRPERSSAKRCHHREIAPHDSPLSSTGIDLPRIGCGPARIRLADDRTLKRIAREIAHRLPRGWSMIRDDSAFSLHCGMERGDVGVTNDCLGSLRYRVIINARQDANDSVTTAQTPQCIDLRIAQRAVDVVQSVAVVPGAVSDTVRGVRRDDSLPTKLTNVFLCAWKIFSFLQWTGGSNERYACAGLERFRAAKMFCWHEILFVARITQ